MIPLSQMIWLRSVTDHPSEPKKGGLYGCSVRKSDFWATFGPKKKTKILCWPRCTAGLGAAAAGFSACNCLFDSHNCLLTSLILDPYYKLNWPKRASAVYWLFGTLLYPWKNTFGVQWNIQMHQQIIFFTHFCRLIRKSISWRTTGTWGWLDPRYYSQSPRSKTNQSRTVFQSKV